jgi:hypothetical protein
MYMSKRFNRVITSATVLLVVMGGLAGCDHVFGVGEQELIQRAKNFKDKGDTKAAIIELKSALLRRAGCWDRYMFWLDRAATPRKSWRRRPSSA